MSHKMSHKKHERGTTGDSQFKTQKGYMAIASSKHKR